MKLISWNVNGLRACIGKGFSEFLEKEAPDCFCIQETKMQREQSEADFEGYREYWNSAIKKGYSGTATLLKGEPESVSYDIGNDAHTGEGRSITVDLGDFYLVNVYTPNSQRGLERLSYRMEWEDAFRAYVCALDQKKPVVICGDMNVAHKPIDLKNPQSNKQNAGFTAEERGKMTELLSCGFADSFRALYPEKIEYTWWSYMFHSREKNTGWRIDYFLVSERLLPRVKDSMIYGDILGSDHCPIGLIIE